MAIKKFHVGVKGLVRDSRRGFIVVGNDYLSGENWTMPGGRIDGNEEIEATLTRELKEELPGIVINKIDSVVHVRRLFIDIDSDETSLMLVYYLVDADLPEEVVISDEHRDYRWINSPNEVPDGLFPEMQTIIGNLLG